MVVSQTTDAFVFRQRGGPLAFERLNVALPTAGQLLVQLVATGICHTDITCASVNSMFPTSSILGHEGAGIVRQVGSDITDKFQIGDPVILSFNFCGNCEVCDQGSPAYCTSFGLLNGPHTQSDGNTGFTASGASDGEPVLGGFFGQSSFSRLALVDANCAVRVPDVSQEELCNLAPLGCGVQTGVGTVLNTLQVRSGSSIAIFGVGAVGLSALIAAKNIGADLIIAVDLVEAKLEMAKQLGATHIINGKADNLVEQVKNIAKSTAGVKYALDTTGAIPVIQRMIDCLGVQGRSVSVGLNGQNATVAIPLMAMLSAGKSFGACTEGDSIPSQLIPYLVSEVRSSRFPLEKLVKFYSVNEFQHAWDEMIGGQVVKPVIRWD